MKKRTKVALVGSATTQAMAPFNDPEFEVWGMNDSYTSLPRYDRWFQLHTPEEINRTAAIHNQRHDWNSQHGVFSQMKVPVYMRDVYPDIPNSVAYPKDDVLKEFEPCFIDPRQARYFTNTAAWMVALAMLEGFTEIHCYGINMAIDGEFGQQRPSCEFWLGVAVGRGIKFYSPAESDLLRTAFLYAYEDERQYAFVQSILQSQNEINTNKTQAEQQARFWNERMLQYIGAAQGIEELKKRFIITGGG